MEERQNSPFIFSVIPLSLLVHGIVAAHRILCASYKKVKHQSH
jgi:hypothetical protein